MFRVFIKSKIESGQNRSEKRVISRTSTTRNRRLSQRYNIDQKHLTLLNDQDILLIRDLSLTGFSSDVSDRAFLRFALGDTYEGKLHCRGTNHPLLMKVSWKRDHVIGFEIIEISKSGEEFLAQILEPMMLGRSLKQSQAQESILENGLVKMSLMGHENLQLDIWFGEGDTISSWTLAWQDIYVEYQQGVGFTTGTQNRLPKVAGQQPISRQKQDSPKLASNKKAQINFAHDIILGLESVHQFNLLRAFEG